MSTAEKLKRWVMAAPSGWDACLLAVFTVLITWHPYFADGKINIFEVGLYLPGIQSVLNGEVPFRDFFHLRGPFEIYMPALLMRLFGMHIKVLYAYFYFGSVLCLVLCVLIAKELFKTRYLLYLMTPVLIGRTFPRVVFTYWGGMRYALGLLALWFVIKYFKKDKPAWMFGAGITSAAALLTSVEMGIYPFLGVLAAMAVSGVFRIQNFKSILKGLGVYLVGGALVAVPYGIYLASQAALIPYLDGVWTIVTRMQKVIDPHLVSVYPSNFPEAVIAMTNPGHTNFKHMTPSYLYIFLLVYLYRRVVRKALSREDLMAIVLGVYGFIMYNTGFRGIWAAQFEMALQPEKVLLFFLFEVFVFAALSQRKILLPQLKQGAAARWHSRGKMKLYLCNAFLFVLIFSSIGYSIQRYNHRFYAFKFMRDKIAGKDTAHLRPLAKEVARTANLKRAKGILLPAEQAEELERVAAYVVAHVKENEELWTYPELGTYNFFVNRRFFGRFPISTFSWFSDRWHAEYLAELKSSKPKFAIVQKELPQYWKDVYLALEPNRAKYQDVMDFIQSQYSLYAETPLSNVYVLK